MVCPERSRIHALLVGRLGRKATLAALDHTRECPECRDALENTAARLAGRGDVAEAMDAASGTDSEVAWADDSRPPQGSRRGMGGYRLVLLGVIIAVLFGARSMFQRNVPGDTRKLEPDQLIVLEALREGLPCARSPRGAIEARPNVFTAYLPPGQGRVTIHVMQRGREVFSRTVTPHDEGCTFDSVQINGPKASYFAIEAMVPFPSSEALPVERGAAYDWFAELADGRTSLPARFIATDR